MGFPLNPVEAWRRTLACWDKGMRVVSAGLGDTWAGQAEIMVTKNGAIAKR